MIWPIRQLFAIAAIALSLWVVPSLGSQGMGTIGQRFNHPDRDLFSANTATSAVSAHLRLVDVAVTTALPMGESSAN